MQTLMLDQKEYPTLITWDPKFLDEILVELCKTANPSKTEITLEEKLSAAQMLEMDLQAQSGAIQETEQEDLLTEHNRKMLKKMKTSKNVWAESYPGELYPSETKEN
nr:hypothetical protein [Chryseobacterium sp. CBo1]